MKILRRIISCVLILCVLLTMTACDSSKMEIRSLMSDFQKSCNDLDGEAMLDCINPKVADTIDAAMKIIGVFTSKSSDELFTTIADVLLGNSLLGTKDFFSTLDIKVESVNVSESGSDANGTATVTYVNSSGEKQTKSATFKCIKSDDRWYISNFSIA